MIVTEDSRWLSPHVRFESGVQHSPPYICFEFMILCLFCPCSILHNLRALFAKGRVSITLLRDLTKVNTKSNCIHVILKSLQDLDHVRAFSNVNSGKRRSSISNSVAACDEDFKKSSKSYCMHFNGLLFPELGLYIREIFSNYFDG